MQITDAEETVKVTLLEGSYAYVETASASACGSCASKSSCGSLNFFSSDKKQSPESGLKVRNTLNLQVGDSAILTIASEKLLLGTLLMYLLPLVSLLVAASIAKPLGGEIFSTVVGLLGFLLTLFFVKNHLKQQKVSNQFEPTLLRKIINIETRYSDSAFK